MRFLLLGGLAGPLFFGLAVVIGAAFRPGYDHAMQVMSALGATGSQYAWIMNGGGFLPTGLMVIGFAVGLHRVVPRSFLANFGTGLLVLFGSGIVSAGIYSCDLGCTGVGTSSDAFLHIVVSAISFVSGIAACFIWGGAFRSDARWRPLSNYSFLTGLASGGLLVAFNSSTETRFYPGIWQRLFIGLIFLWCAIVGVYGFRVSGRSKSDTRFVSDFVRVDDFR